MTEKFASKSQGDYIEFRAPKNNVWGLLQIHSDENRISDKRILRNQLLCCVQQEFSISIFIISRWLHIIFATKLSHGQFEKLHCSLKKLRLIFLRQDKNNRLQSQRPGLSSKVVTACKVTYSVFYTLITQ